MKFLALDSPVLDIVLMRREQLFEVVSGYGDLSHEIMNAYDNLMGMLINRNDRPGDKNDLNSPQEIEKLESAISSFHQMLPESINIYFLGGSGCRKLHHIFAALCDAECVLMGAVKNNSDGEFLKQQLLNSHVELFDNNVELKHSRKSLIYTLPGQNDRVVLRFPFKLPKNLYSNAKVLSEQISKADVIMLETSRIDQFKGNVFEKILEQSHKNNKDIVFFPPTGKEIFKSKSTRELILKIAKQSKLMIMNAEEAISTFLDYRYGGKISGKEDADLKTAMDKIQDLMRERQFCIITLGSSGSYGVTKNDLVFMGAYEVLSPENTLGAGDAFCGGVIAKFFTTYKELKITKATIKEILDYASHLSSIVIQQPGGLIDSRQIACMWESE